MSNAGFNKWGIKIDCEYLVDPIIAECVNKAQSPQDLVVNLIKELQDTIEKVPADVYSLIKEEDEHEKERALYKMEIQRLKQELKKKQ